MELNQVFLAGNLTRDPETNHLKSGTQVCKFGIASNRKFTANGEKKEEVLFITVECWGKTAELCQKYLSRGSGVLVQGRLKMDQYETKEGDKRTAFLIVADRVNFMPRASEGRSEKPQSRSDSDATDGGSQEVDDDLPF